MIKLENIACSFIFQNLNLSVEKGEFVVVIGDNGAGKSTIMNLVSGAVLPMRGSVTIDDVDVTKLNEHRRAEHIAYIFQDPKLGTNGNMTVSENLALALHKGDFSLKRAIYKEDYKKFRELTDLDLDQQVGTLSGGQRQKLSLVMATMHKPKILLLDEHTAALDPQAAKEVMEMTDNIIRENGLTALMVTHSIPSSVKYGDRLIFMRDGKIKDEITGVRKIEDVTKLYE